MKTIVLVVSVLLLGGCTPPAVREFNAWADVERPRAKSGEIPWSQFYKEAYARLERAPTISGKAEAMERYSKAIVFAQLYETGRITKDEFETFQRDMTIEAERQAQVQDAASRRAMGNALQDFGNKAYAPRTQQQAVTNCVQTPNQYGVIGGSGSGMNCTTR